MKDTMNMEEGMPTLSRLGKPYVMGHIGALSFHPVFVFPADWSDEEKNKGIDEAFYKEGEINAKYGTCGGEWGQFARRTSFYIKRYGEVAYQMVKKVKKVFDPNNILNPDVFRD
jgi:FAD/FMN-containing dehydrogenase